MHYKVGSPPPPPARQFIATDVVQITLPLYIDIFNIDIDECDENLHDCDPDADCFNEPGSYYCSCKTGYSGDGYSCIGTLTIVATNVFLIVCGNRNVDSVPPSQIGTLLQSVVSHQYNCQMELYTKCHRILRFQENICSLFF